MEAKLSGAMSGLDRAPEIEEGSLSFMIQRNLRIENLMLKGLAFSPELG